MKTKIVFFISLVLIFPSCERNNLYDSLLEGHDRTADIEIEYNLRDTGPAGGLIFYINPNADIDGWKYLEIAPASTEWTGVQWGSKGTFIDNTQTGIGSGPSNTNAILPYVGLLNAASLCDNLTINVNGVEFSDWFLPSQDELWDACWNLVGKQWVSGVSSITNPDVPSPLGGFSGNYLSSTEYDATNATGYNLSIGYLQLFMGKDGGYSVRAIRAF